MSRGLDARVFCTRLPQHDRQTGYRNFHDDAVFAIPENPKRPDIRECQKKGIARLGKVVGRKRGDSSPPPGTGTLFQAGAHGDCYFLWSLERVALIYGLDEIEGKDWYKWGSDVLLKEQHADGYWSERFEPSIDTAFAIFFLTRCNLAKDLTESIRTRDGRVAQ